MQRGGTAVLYYLAAVNAAAFILFGADKLRAVRKKRRIRERTLMITAAAGGSAGALAAMLAFHHKTRKPLFAFGVPVLLVLQTAAAVLLMRH